jgi:hypothetical protein
VCKLRLDMFEFYYEQNPSAKQHGHGWKYSFKCWTGCFKPKSI